MHDNIGPRKLVVGAHYGVKDWFAQRATAVVMIIYTVILLFYFLTAGSVSYEAWRELFSRQTFKLLSFVTFLGLLYHAWVGMRNIWMDYIKPVSLRLGLQILTILWLLACTGWAIQILWKV